MYFDQLHNCSHQLNSVKAEIIFSHAKHTCCCFCLLLFSDCVEQKMFVFQLIKRYGDKLLQL